MALPWSAGAELEQECQLLRCSTSGDLALPLELILMALPWSTGTELEQECQLLRCSTSGELALPLELNLVALVRPFPGELLTSPRSAF